MSCSGGDEDVVAASCARPMHSSSSSGDDNSGADADTCVATRSRDTHSAHDAYWQRKRQERRARVRAAAAARRAAQHVEWQNLDAAAQAARKAAAARVHDQRRAAAAAHEACCVANLHNPHTPTLVFDLSLAWCMSVADTRSTVAQIKLSYSALRRAAFVLRPVIVCTAGREVDAEDEDEDDDVGGEDDGDGKRGCIQWRHDAAEVAPQAAVLATLHAYDGFRRYPPHVTHTEHWRQLYSRAGATTSRCSSSDTQGIDAAATTVAQRATTTVVVLTADADEVLYDVAPSVVYVIGAFVDHNRYKGLMRRAAERHAAAAARARSDDGAVVVVRTAKLPLHEALTSGLGNRCTVLTINHVTEVLVRFVQMRDAHNDKQDSTREQSRDVDAAAAHRTMLLRCWAAAFDAVLPTRRVHQAAAAAGVLQCRRRHRGSDDDSDASVEAAEGCT